MTQINLLNVPVASDVVYTPNAIARDIVAHFRPTGRVLEPAAGDGAFLRYMPNAEWCELEKGRDFFAWTERVDWIVSNPPYSIFAEFLRHSFTIADNIVYLIPANKPFNSHVLLQDIYRWGGIRHCMVIGRGASLNLQIGFAVAAYHFQRGYTGGMTVSFWGGDV